MAGYFELSVVALGRFNPAIFQPSWFRTNDILPAAEVDAAEAGGQRVLVTNDVTAIMFESVRVDVQKERWSLSTSRQDWRKDIGPIASSIFALLPHTPVTTLGFNYSMHRYLVGGEPALSRLLHKWVPIEDLADVVGKRVHLGGTVRCDWDDYRVTFTLDSSVRLTHGIYFGQNYERKVESATMLTEYLQQDWPKILSRAKDLIEAISEGEELEA